ncbi:UPF0052-domain-containing protein [Exidia glandulosa HHB12029]|uniref:UPF0052-domain-containing protein n=1 Tax=Exidia glandulosa HHB12029 TaxID=1314781 RepID=A0A165PCP1_EXIGL|nr:UPF0052-domain-containing protein [Exidia glandulosa HHB12029]
MSRHELNAPIFYNVSSATSSVFDIPTYNDSNAQRITPTPRDSRSPFFDAAASDDGESTPILVVSGGTGCNSICSAFGRRACYVLPVSDNGGSSAEIIRVLGGPSIGDIRSRLIRLIPDTSPSSPLGAIRTLLAHRIPPSLSEDEARVQWRAIVEGHSDLWHGIPADRKETIRGFLVYFEGEVLKRADKLFSFRNGSVGNYFLAGAQHFFRSLPSAIFLFSSITTSQAVILPVVVTNHTVTIAAKLTDDTTLVGQCEISHPVGEVTAKVSFEDEEDGEDAVAVQTGNAVFSKDSGEQNALPAPISKLYYINAYGQETFPKPNPDFLRKIKESELLIYSCGSLWTSIIPCLALRGVAHTIASSNTLRSKVLLLNSRNDRETTDYTAVDYLTAMVRTLNESDAKVASARPPSAYVTHLVYLANSAVTVDVRAIEALGVRCVCVHGKEHDADGVPRFDTDAVHEALQQL